MLAFNLETNAGVAIKNPTIRDGKHQHFAQWVAQEILGWLWQLKGVNFIMKKTYNDSYDSHGVNHFLLGTAVWELPYGPENTVIPMLTPLNKSIIEACESI